MANTIVLKSKSNSRVGPERSKSTKPCTINQLISTVLDIITTDYINGIDKSMGHNITNSHSIRHRDLDDAFKSTGRQQVTRLHADKARVSYARHQGDEAERMRASMPQTSKFHIQDGIRYMRYKLIGKDNCLVDVIYDNTRASSCENLEAIRLVVLKRSLTGKSATLQDPYTRHLIVLSRA